MVKSPSLTTLLPNYTMYFIIFVDAESIEFTTLALPWAI